MYKSLRLASGVAGLLMIAIGGGRASAMGMEAFGPAGERVSRQPDWPAGIENVLRHPSRVYWQWVNGSEWAYYDGNLNAINELLELFSRVGLAEHLVVILPGKLEAKSFHGKSTPYAVELDMPGKLELHARKSEGREVLRAPVPRLIVVLDAKLAEQLDGLKIPPNVTLQSSPVDVEAAAKLAQAADAEPRARREAMFALANSGNSSPKVLEVLQQAAASDDAAIRAAGEQALERMSAVQQAVDPELRRRVKQFVEQHSRNDAPERK